MEVGIVGLGAVGSTIAYSVAVSGLASRLVLVDQFTDKAVGEAMDLNHCASFIPPVDVEAGGLELCHDMQVVIVTAGTKRQPNELRTDLIKRNLDVFKKIAKSLAESNPRAIFIVVSNPVDLLTLFLHKCSDLPPAQVIGSGTLLDTSRFRYLISERLNVDPRNVHAYIIGEHGSGSVPVWSHTQIGVLPLDDFVNQSGIKFGPEEKQAVFEKVLTAGKEVIERKGATFYGIAQSVLRILTAISRDEKSILTLCTDVQGFSGVEDLTLSIPVVIGRGGIEKSLIPHLDKEEMDGFKKAASSLESIAREVGII